MIVIHQKFVKIKKVNEKGWDEVDHYYSSQPSSESNRKKINVKLGQDNFTLFTDTGVFSKDKIDQGSQVLIHAAQKSNFPKGNLLDLGCGYGIIGLSLAKQFSNRTIEMIDVNERALTLSEDNAKLNKIDNVKIYHSNIFDQVENKKFAGIISNPPIRAGKKVVHQILEESYDHLVDGGRLQIVIQRKQGAPSAKKKMNEVFGNVERIELEKGYWVLESVR